MHYCSNAIKYIPDLDDSSTPLFKTMAGEGAPEVVGADGEVTEDAVPGAKLSPETIEAAGNLDDVIRNLYEHFSGGESGHGIDYFKILVDVFKKVMVNDTNTHLHSFFQILPALTVNFVETNLQAKDLMYKNNRKKECYFSDDGFAIGVAYILAILDQGKQFDSLHWFETVTLKHRQDQEELQKRKDRSDAKAAAAQQRRGGGPKGKKGARSRAVEEEDEEDGGDLEEEVHTLQLTGKRLEQHKREFDLLFFSLSGARIFFKEADTDDSKKK